MIYFNENDTFAANWISRIHPAETIDRRSIADVTDNDVQGFKRVHLFAGIAGWEYALQLAGWPEGRPVWTGSCPCQPFSIAGRRKWTADPRHLWPEMLRLITLCRPSTIFGEQVASPDGRQWLAGVRADLEALGYAFGAADLCAAGVGAPHKRQRLYWVADADDARWQSGESPSKTTRHRNSTESDGGTVRMGDSMRRGLEMEDIHCSGGDTKSVLREASVSGEPVPFDFWGKFDVAHFLDGKSRRIEPGTFPLAHGVPVRVGRICGYGNAVVPQLAAVFIQSFLECKQVETQ